MEFEKSDWLILLSIQNYSLSNDMHNMHIYFRIKKIMFLVDHDHHDVILVVKMTESGQTKTRFGILMKFWSDTIVDLGWPPWPQISSVSTTYVVLVVCYIKSKSSLKDIRLYWEIGIIQKSKCLIRTTINGLKGLIIHMRMSKYLLNSEKSIFGDSINFFGLNSRKC